MEDASGDYVKKEESAFASCLYSASSTSTPSSVKHEEALSIYGSVPSHVKVEPDPHHLYSASAAAAAIGLLHPHPNSVYDPLPQRNWLSDRTSQVRLQFHPFIESESDSSFQFCDPTRKSCLIIYDLILLHPIQLIVYITLITVRTHISVHLGRGGTMRLKYVDRIDWNAPFD